MKENLSTKNQILKFTKINAIYFFNSIHKNYILKLLYK
jgi:hypothetical protein